MYYFTVSHICLLYILELKAMQLLIYDVCIVTLYKLFVYNISYFMRFTLYPIEPAKESGSANTTEGYNTDKLPMESQV